MSLAKIKKGNTVIMCGFTGMKLGVYPVVKADAKIITIKKADGSEVEFDRKSGKQLNPKNPAYANIIIEDDGSYVNPRDIRKATKAKQEKAEMRKKAAEAAKAKKKKVKEDEEEELEEDDEEEEASKKKPAKSKKPSKKKVKEPEPEEDDDDDDEYEEVDDDEE